MKIKVLIAGAGYGPKGTMTSWAPNSVVDVDDRDKASVAFYRGWVKAGMAEIVEESAAPAVKASTEEATKTPTTKKSAT